MSIKEIITVPDPILKKISSPIEKISINEKKLIKDLKDTMYNAKGIGLAAIQIGIPKRIVIVDVTKEDDKVEQVIDANVNNILNKVHKVTGDLKINKDGNNLNTVIVPVEVIATTGGGGGGGSGGSEERPDPVVAQNNLVLD